MTARLALVTGASAGIGAAFAEVLAAHGYDLALTARRPDRLTALADRLSLRHGVQSLVIPADLADAAAPDAILAEIAAHGRQVDALINNAGYGIAGAFNSVTWQRQADFLRVLTLAPCELAHKLAPAMAGRRFGRIVNVASLAGLIPGAPGAALYGAAKAFMVRFSQGLHLELRAQGVHVTALCPGLTYSEFHDVNHTRETVGSRTPPWLWLGADEVAAMGYEAVEANRPICVTGAPNKAISAAAKLLPEEWGMTLMASQASRITQ
jgi:short-subunit dehydrogenase